VVGFLRCCCSIFCVWASDGVLAGAVWVPSPLPIFAEFAAELPPPHTLALSSQCIPAFWQSARVKGCGAASAGPKLTANTISKTRILMVSLPPALHGVLIKPLSPKVYCPQLIENIDAALAHLQEFETSLPHVNSWKELHFEEWP